MDLKIKLYVKSLLKASMKLLGYEINKIAPKLKNAGKLQEILNELEINTIFDIGANIGQFACEVRSNGYFGKIISFEPLSQARLCLLKRSEKDSNWIVHNQCAIGNFDGEIDINISKNSYSSSILPILESHTNVATDSKYIGIEKVPIFRLDSVMSEYLNNNTNLFIKMDTQGYESQVIEGGEVCLKQSLGIFCELSLVPLYKGQTLWLEMIEQLDSLGFELKVVFEGFKNSETGELLQINGLFTKKRVITSNGINI